VIDLRFALTHPGLFIKLFSKKIFVNNSSRGLEKYVLIPAGTTAATHRAHGGFVAAITGTSTQRKGVV